MSKKVCAMWVELLDDAPSVYCSIVCAGMTGEQMRLMEEKMHFRMV